MKKRIIYMVLSGILMIAIILTIAVVYQKYQQKKEAEALLQQELQALEEQKVQKAQAIAETLDLVKQEEFNALLLSMFPMDTYAANVLYEGRGDMVAMLEQPLQDTEELLDILMTALNSSAGIDRVFLGLDMEKTEAFSDVVLEENASFGSAREWLSTNLTSVMDLVSLAKEYPEVTFEIVLSYPGVNYLLSEKDTTVNRLLQWYKQAGTLLSQYNEVPNIHVFMPGSEEWLICNESNYVDDYKLNQDITDRLISHVFCDYNYIVTPNNLSEKIDTLKGLLEEYADFETINQSEYTYVFFGDSVIGNYTDTTSIPKVVAYLTGAEAINCGYGGLSAAKIGDGLGLPDIIDTFLAENENLNSEKLVFFICFGINDYASGMPLKSNMSADKGTFKGAIEYAVAMLKATYPASEIVLMTPNFISLGNFGTSAEHGMVYEEYVDIVLDLCEASNIKCIDIYHDLGMNAGNTGEYLSDECHPNEYGRLEIGKLIFEHLSEWYPQNE